MRWIFILTIWFAVGTNSYADRYSSEPIIYLADVQRFEYTPEPEPEYEVRDGQEVIIVSNGCGDIHLELNVLQSTKLISKSLSVANGIGEWCATQFDWPYIQYLIIADGTPEDIIAVFNTDGFDYAYTFSDAYEWSEELRDWLGQDLLQQLRPVRIDEPESVSVYEIPNFAMEAIWYQYDSDKSERARTDRIVRFDGSEVTFLKAIKLSNIFPEMAEE